LFLLTYRGNPDLSKFFILLVDSKKATKSCGIKICVNYQHNTLAILFCNALQTKQVFSNPVIHRFFVA